MTWEFERVAGPFSFAEGPVWTGSSVWFTDESRIIEYDPSTDETAVVFEETNDGCGMHIGPDGSLYVCEPDARRMARYEDETRTTVVDSYRGDALNSPNDVEIDASGRMWFTDPRYGPEDDLELSHKSVYLVEDPTATSPSIRRVTTDTTQPNGLLVSPDESTLFVAQSEYGEGNDRELRAYPINDDGSVGEYEVLHNFYPHRGIDGMCFDDDGNIVATAGWTESGPGPMLYVFTPSGRVLETHPIEETPTNCTFGGDDGRTLFVTTTGGSLYQARTDRTGLLDHPEINWR